jgi:hypothetical protein
MTGLDFWATDPHTDSVLPFFDQWSTEFMLQEWTREVMRDEIMLALRSVPHGHDE